VPSPGGGATPDPANRIDKDIGATWGAVQYQVGDTDGFWAALLHRTAERRAEVFAAVGRDKPSGHRVAAVARLRSMLGNSIIRPSVVVTVHLPRPHCVLAECSAPHHTRGGANVVVAAIDR
jgi:hypothetical protein